MVQNGLAKVGRVWPLFACWLHANNNHQETL
jgi:hypothetical protein